MICLSTVERIPPAGTRCFYRNDALQLEGWGVLADPADDIDAEEMPFLLPWIGTIVGPKGGGSVWTPWSNAPSTFENHDMHVWAPEIAPGKSMVPGERYMLLGRNLLWVEDAALEAAP